jgi:small multidrug resistance pump
VSWLLLAAGVLLEVAGTLCMKASNGFSDWRAATLMYVLYGLSLTVLTFAFKRLDVGVAYAVWSGAGIVLIATAGIVWFREPASAIRFVFIVLILIGMIGLHVVGAVATGSGEDESVDTQQAA